MNIEPWERNYRSSRSQILFKISVLKNFTSFTGKHLCWSLFLIKLQIWRLANLLWRNSNTGAMRKKLQSSRSQIFFKIGVIKNFSNFTGKYLCWSIFLIKLQTWRPAALLRRGSNTGVFLEIDEIFKNTFFTEHLWWLLLKLNICFSCRFITYY